MVAADAASDDPNRAIVEPFVRRVATRVFRRFWAAIKDDLTARNLRNDDAAVVQGIMSPRGARIRCAVIEPPTPAQILAGPLLEACESELRDGDPPPEARSESGEIAFRFLVRAEELMEKQRTEDVRSFFLRFEAGLD